MSFSQAEINDIVLKKIQTSPFTSTGNTITTESPGTSAYKIQQSNIYASPIPAIAPAVTLDGSLGDYEGGSKYIGNGEYNYIIKYDKVELKKTVDTSSWRSYYYKGTDTANVISTNILSDAIPSNQDPGGTYGIVIWNGDNAYTGNFFFDTASGYVTFASTISFTPTITFWRYEGSKGININNIEGNLAVTLDTIENGNNLSNQKGFIVNYTGSHPLSTADYGGLAHPTGFQTNCPFRIYKSDYSTYGIGLDIGHFADTGDAYIQCQYANTGAKDICLQPYAGNVGIGTTNPPTLLSVGEATSIVSNVSYNSSYPPLLNVSHSGYHDDGSIAHFSRGAGVWQIGAATMYHKRGTGDILKMYTTSGNVRFGNGTRNTYITFRTNGKISLDGNVGIGTSNPSKLLHLVGNNTNANNVMEIGPGPTGGIGATIRWRHSPYNDGSPWYCSVGVHDTWSWPRWVVNTSDGGRAIEVDRYAGVILEGSEYSDDRLKKNEAYITNALHTLSKLKPQIYNKHIQNFESDTFEITDNYKKESGIIAQEVFYDAPELRHLINIHQSVNIEDLSNNNVSTSNDPQIDPDYSNWGPRAATVNYTGFIAYLIKGIQEQQEIIEAEKAKTATLESQVAALLAKYPL